MDLVKTHKKLMKHNKLYAAWHKNPTSIYWNWFFLIYVAYLVNVIVIAAVIEVTLNQTINSILY